MTRPSWLVKLKGKLARPPRELAMFFASSLAGRGLGIACQLLQVPIAVKTLGAEGFGLWMTLTSISNFVTFADFGVGIGVQNKMAEAFAHHDTERARAIFGSGFLFLTAVAAVLAAIAVLGTSVLDYASAFRLTDPATIAEAHRGTLVFLLIFCVGFPLALAQRLAFGRHEGWMYNVAQAFGSVVALGSIAVAARLGGGLTWFIIGGQGALMLSNLVLLVAQLARQGWLRTRWLVWRFALVRELLALGAHFGVQQVLTTILFPLPALIISTQLGAAVLTPYSLLQRLFNLFAMIQNAFMLPLWPAYSRAKARGEFGWMKRTLKHSLLATLAFCVAPMFVCALLTDPILRLWVGDPPPMPASLVWLFFGWNALLFLQQPFNYLLAGASEVRRVTFYSVASAVASTVLMYAFVGPYGAPGVLLGRIAGFLPFNGLGNVIESFRYLRSASASARKAGPNRDELAPIAAGRESLGAKV